MDETPELEVDEEDGLVGREPEEEQEGVAEDEDAPRGWAGSNSGAEGRRGSDETPDGAWVMDALELTFMNTTGTDSVDDEDDARDRERIEDSPAAEDASTETSILLSGVAVPPLARPSTEAESSAVWPGSGPLKILSLASSYSAWRSS